MIKLSCTLSAALLAVFCMATSAQAREKAVQPCDEGQKPPCVDGKSVASAARTAPADSGALKAKKARYVEKLKNSCRSFSGSGAPVFSGGENAHTIKACCGANDAQFSIKCVSCGCGALSGSGCDCCEQRDPSKINWDKVTL